MDSDSLYMDRAIELAKRGIGRVNPNPLVGALIVKEGRIIGEGWHEYYGGLHAERNALKNCTENTAGATMYVTLEPCCHYGKTPPCTEALIENGIARVVTGMKDPNPLVAGKGIRILENAGIEVISGINEEKIRKLNRVFIKYITTGMPWVLMKTAMTLDGKTATACGDSKWVSSEESRKLVHKIRNACMGIIAGSGTVLADNPMLNCRLARNETPSGEEPRQPVRIIISSQAKIPAESAIVRTAKQYRTILAHTDIADAAYLDALRASGIETVLCPDGYRLTDTRHDMHGDAGHGVDLHYLMEYLGKSGIDSVLLEGGGTLNSSFLSEGLVDEIWTFVAPKIAGGKNAPSPVGGEGVALMKDAILLDDITMEKSGNDILIKGICKKQDIRRR